MLEGPAFPAGEPRRSGRAQDHELDKHFDVQLIDIAKAALLNGEPVMAELPIANTERAVGTMLGHQVTSRHGATGLPKETIDVTLTGTAGQSLGAFLPPGIILRLEGDANDYVGKGLSGGDITIRPPRGSAIAPHENVIAGNVIGYGATSGTMFISGVVGERFLVRNSGATAVVEGVGDHALEYMTGGLAVILGSTGRNFGAGMSGGVAYVHALDTAKVNAQSLGSGELRLEPLDRADLEVLRGLLVEHVERTASPRAAALLEDFDASAAEFVKVLPRDFAAVRSMREEALAEGIDPDGDIVWNRILEVTGG